jgi:hypothetical protein
VNNAGTCRTWQLIFGFNKGLEFLNQLKYHQVFLRGLCPMELVGCYSAVYFDLSSCYVGCNIHFGCKTFRTDSESLNTSVRLREKLVALCGEGSYCSSENGQICGPFSSESLARIPETNGIMWPT